MSVPIASALLLAVACSLSAPLRAQSYLVMHFDPEAWEELPTYLFVRKPGQSAHPARHVAFEHFKLDGRLTLIPLRTGVYEFLHLDFSRTTRGDSRSRRFKVPWPVRIHRDALHYFGPGAFAPPDVSAGYAEQILDLLCNAFPEEVSRLHEFRAVHYQQESVPLRYTCLVDGDLPPDQQHSEAADGPTR